jgi:hypothetical protein
MNMIDELAKALCEDAGWKWCRHPVLDERYRRRVRTVLRRLREPTPEMVNWGAIAALETREKQRKQLAHRGAGDEAAASFRAMIDAALGERGA